MGIRVFHRDRPSRRLPMIASDARLVIWPGVGAMDANMNYVVMEAGEENLPHVHPESEDAIYCLEGRGTIHDLTNDTSLEFGAGDLVFVPPGVRHQVCGDRGTAIVSVGGPSPADLVLLERAGVDVEGYAREAARDSGPGATSSR
jgi:quercetin dioxygenase-like cupin family protein